MSGRAENAPVLGTDLLIEDGDLAIEAGDLATVAGLENLKAALYRRLLADRGELPLHPEYGGGLEEMVSDPVGPTNLGRIADRVRAQLRQEPRIASFEGVDVSAVGSVVTIVIERVVTIDGQAAGNLVFPLEMEV